MLPMASGVLRVMMWIPGPTTVPGAGLWLMLGSIADRLRYIGAIPGFIGVALLLYAVLAAMFRRKDQPRPQDPPIRS